MYDAGFSLGIEESRVRHAGLFLASSEVVGFCQRLHLLLSTIGGRVFCFYNPDILTPDSLSLGIEESPGLIQGCTLRQVKPLAFANSTTSLPGPRGDLIFFFFSTLALAVWSTAKPGCGTNHPTPLIGDRFGAVSPTLKANYTKPIFVAYPTAEAVKRDHIYFVKHQRCLTSQFESVTNYITAIPSICQYLVAK